MNYEIIPQEETVLVKIKEDDITESIDLFSLPDEGCSWYSKVKGCPGRNPSGENAHKSG